VPTGPERHATCHLFLTRTSPQKEISEALAKVEHEEGTAITIRWLQMNTERPTLGGEVKVNLLLC
jgi:hypothetical protein